MSVVKSGTDLAERKPKWKFYELITFLDKILVKKQHMFRLSENVKNNVNVCKLKLFINYSTSKNYVLLELEDYLVIIVTKIFTKGTMRMNMYKRQKK